MANTLELEPKQLNSDWGPTIEGGTPYDSKYAHVDMLVGYALKHPDKQLREGLSEFLDAHTAEFVQGDSWRSELLDGALSAIDLVQASPDGQLYKEVFSTAKIDDKTRADFSSLQTAKEEFASALGFQMKNETLTPEHDIAEMTSHSFPGIKMMRVLSRKAKSATYRLYSE